MALGSSGSTCSKVCVELNCRSVFPGTQQKRTAQPCPPLYSIPHPFPIFKEHFSLNSGCQTKVYFRDMSGGQGLNKGGVEKDGNIR